MLLQRHHCGVGLGQRGAGGPDGGPLRRGQLRGSERGWHQAVDRRVGQHRPLLGHWGAAGGGQADTGEPGGIY